MKFKQRLGLLSILIMLGLVFTMGCTHDNPLPPTPYEAADLGVGGIMYDKFWSSEAGFDQNDPNFTLYDDNADFFRCKQCHAWDGLGTSGSYNNREPNATRPNVSSLNLYEIAQTKTAEELFDAMKTAESRRDISYDLSQYNPDTNPTDGDKMPNYSQILTDVQIWNIVKFMKEGMFDVSKLYSATYVDNYPLGLAVYNNLGLDGDAVNGNAYYTANCASCHGADGNDFLLGNVGVGGFTRSKPYEVQHKVKYGQLGSLMKGEFDITLGEMKDLYRALSNTTDFPNPTSTGPISYSSDIQPFFDNQCISCHNAVKVGAGTYPLNLEAPGSYNELISGNFINTTAPSSSVLYTKLTGSMAGFSTPAGTSKTLKWIEEGAANN